MPFQTSVNVQPAPAEAGDFASANPRFSVLAGPGSLVAGASGVTIGAFCWGASSGVIDPSTGEIDAFNVVNSTGTGVPLGFVGRRGNVSMITVWLAESTYVMAPGQPVTVHSGGDFWARCSTVAVAGQAVFANLTTGAISSAAAGATVTGSIQTPWLVASSGNTAGDLVKITTNNL